MDYYRDVINRNLERAVLVKDKALREAVLYSLNAGGKRLRPVLLLATANSVRGGSIKRALPFACALEMIHTYSLIHDDLPAMDNDSMRRGRPTNHIMNGEGMAILAGDSLLNGAYEVMANFCLKKPSWRHMIAMSTIARAAGAMVEGQSKDITGVKTVEELIFMQTQKTAALFSAALTAGAVVGKTAYPQVKILSKAGHCLGLAYQIKDDYDEATQPESFLGKSKSDAKNNKATYVTAFGVQKALEDINTLKKKAMEYLNRSMLRDTQLQRIFESILKIENL